MNQKKCSFCGDSYKPRNVRHRFCSGCKRARWAAYMRDWTLKAGKVSQGLGESSCADCGAVYVKKTHNNSRCIACRRKRQLALKRESGRKSRNAAKVVVCVMCGRNAPRTSSGQKTCVDCRPAYWKDLNARWARRNPDVVSRIRRRLYSKRRSDPICRLNGNMSGMIGYSLKTKGGRSWESLVDFTLDELISHLESKFSSGMRWGNYGLWHVDHIRPIASFNIMEAGDSEFRECWSLSNLQPLWADENRRKTSRWNGRVHRRPITKGVAI